MTLNLSLGDITKALENWAEENDYRLPKVIIQVQTIEIVAKPNFVGRCGGCGEIGGGLFFDWEDFEDWVKEHLKEKAPE